MTKMATLKTLSSLRIFRSDNQVKRILIRETSAPLIIYVWQQLRYY